MAHVSARTRGAQAGARVFAAKFLDFLVFWVGTPRRPQPERQPSRD